MDRHDDAPTFHAVSMNVMMHTFFWFGVQCYVIPMLLKMCVKQYTDFTPEKKIVWDIRGTTMLFALWSVSFASSILLLNEDVYNEDMFVHTPFTQFIIENIAGLFVWDLFVCLKYYHVWGLQFLIHGLFCSTMFLMVAYTQLGVSFGLRVVLYECSNFFMNIRQFMKELKHFDSKWWILVNVCFACTFFASRVIYGTYLTCRVLYAMCTYSLPLWFKGVVCINGLMSYALNLYWGSLILRTLKRALN